MISIVIVNWNTGTLLSRCLQSLGQLPEKGLINKIYIIDNNSADLSIEEAQRLHTNLSIEYILLEKNVGFAKANNVALRKIAENPTHTLLLNPDTEVQPVALQAMLNVLEKYPKAGIVGPQLLNPDQSLQPSVRSFPNTLVLAWIFLKLHRLFPKVSWWRNYMKDYFDYYKEQPVDQVMGAAFLVRDKLLSQIGLLDEDFWIWFEEVDYCKRAKNKGWEVWYTPPAQVIHHGGVSFKQLVGFKRTAPFLNSGLTYAHKHLSKLGHLFLCLLWPFAALLSLPASLFHLYGSK